MHTTTYQKVFYRAGPARLFRPEIKRRKNAAAKMKRTLTLLTLYAITMALLESAVVVYMRRLYYPDNPLNLFPLQFLNSYDSLLEISREASTIAMILIVALLAERGSTTRRFAAFVYVFGVWDLFYYFWLKVLMDWPVSWLEWDVLFLIPILWLGPWICPAMIALLFVTWGFHALHSTKNISFTSRSLVVFICGAITGLIPFLQPAAAVMMEGGSEALSQYTPNGFWWWLFVPGFLLMTWGLGLTLRGEENKGPYKP